MLKPGLKSKLLILVTCASLFTILISSALLYSFHRRQIINNAYSTAEVMGSGIQASLHHAMLNGDWLMVNEVVQAVTAENEINALRILDVQGFVGVSSVPGEAGQRFSMQSQICQSCHAAGVPANDSQILSSLHTGRQALLNVRLIENQPECHACHSAQQAVLGLLMLEMPLDDLTGQLSANFWRSALLALATFIMLVGILVPVINRYVIQPVEALSKGVEEVGSGNLDYLVQVAQADELGDLADSFNDMRRQLKTAQDRMKRREQDLAILNEVGRAVTQLRDLQEILDFTLNLVMERFDAESGLINLWDEAEKRLDLRASKGLTPEQIETISERRRSGYDISHQVAVSGKEVFVPNMALDRRFIGIWDPLEGRSYINLPLMSRGIVVGVMAVITSVGQSFTHAEVDFLKSVGREVGIAIDNALLLARYQQREQQAITLHELGTKISASLALSDVLNAVAESARELLNADIGLVGMLDEVSQEIVIRSAAGPQAEALKGERIRVAAGEPAGVLAKGQPYLIEAYVPGQPLLHDLDSYTGEQIASFLAVPLQRGERFLGLVEVMAFQPRRFLADDAQLLMRLAHQVVVSIENAQLYRQLRSMATLEERDRLAREMHDHLAQTLGYLNVKALMTGDLVSRREYHLALESLDELKRAAKIAYTDVREAIFNLRTTVSAGSSLLASLQEYLTQYGRHYGLDAHLVIENDDTDEFSPEVTGQLLHIIQEALTNVRKHSDASLVLVRYDQSGTQVRVTIEDNGQGFVPEEVSDEGHQHVGLNVMRERAESIGGTLVLDSQLGQGTKVIVTAPTIIEE